MFVSRRCLLFSSTLKGFSFSHFIVFVTKRFVRRGLEYCVVERSPLLRTVPQGQGQGREQGQGHCYVRGLLGMKCHIMFTYTAEIQILNYNPAFNCQKNKTVEKFVYKNYYFIEYAYKTALISKLNFLFRNSMLKQAVTKLQATAACRCYMYAY